MLPKPSAAFTLPSLYDDLELKCRLYFPTLQTGTDELVLASGIAIFAHPYAPLGGCFDDPVVHSVGSVLHKQGYILATFNFRGAEGSSGKTSWSGKGELGDYTSLYMFMLSFLGTEGVSQYLRHGTQPLLVLGGYSYGSMIISHLPSLDTVRGILQHSKEGSSEHEIEVRAIELAKSFLGYCETQHHYGSNSLKALGKSTPTEIVYGGYESPLAAHRISDQGLKGRMDKEKIRHSVEKARRKLSGHTDLPNEVSILDSESSEGARQLSVTPNLAFLLVSPLMGTTSSLATMFSKLRFERVGKSARSHPATPNESTEQLFSKHPTLIVFGSDDHFTSPKKVRDWCKSMANAPESQLQYTEVEGVGHFWHDSHSEARLVSSVSTWHHSLTN